MVVYIDRVLDLKMTIWVAQGTTVWGLKEQLAHVDPTGKADPSSIGLKLPSPSEEVLGDDEPLSARLMELEVCTPLAPDAWPQDEAEEEEAPDAWPEEEACPPRAPPRVDVAMECGCFEGLDVPEGCSVGQWRQMLGSGELLGEKVLYVGKLNWHAVSTDKGSSGSVLADSAALPLQPDSLMASGPGSVLKILELALGKRLGPPNTARKLQQAAGAGGTSQQLPLKLSGRDEHLEFFSLGLKGNRSSMEDRTSATLRLPGYEKVAFFGVYDGHGGDQVADLVARHLPTMLAEELKEMQDPSKAFESAFSIADNALRSAMKGNSKVLDLVGSTAITVAIIREGGMPVWYLCGNCGDSRAVLCRGGKALELSRDHKPDETSERDRIVAAGGSITMQGRIGLHGAGAGLNLSRAFGDFAYKTRTDLSSQQQQITAHPELWGETLQADDEFIALGSDGVFDALSSDELVAHLRAALCRGESLEKAVKSALDVALQSNDNVTLCLIRLPGGWSLQL